MTEHALTTLPWAVVLSAVAAVLAWRAFRRGQYARTVRWGGWVAIVWAVWLVGLMRLVVRIGSAVADWAAGFVFRPTVWLGLVVGVIGVLLVAGGSLVARRRGRKEPRPVEGTEPAKQSATKKPAQPSGRQAVPEDDMSDIEAILKKHGIE